MTKPKVDIATPQFERPTHWPQPKDPPTDMKGWIALHSKTRAELKEIGLTHWEKGLFLFPAEWYDAVPEGLDVVMLTGVRRRFDRKAINNDKRMGCLPFGVLASDAWKE